MPDSDAAFLWESEALRSSSTSPSPSRGQHERRVASSDWVTLRDASEQTGIPLETIRKWARRDFVPSFLEETTVGQLRMVSMSGVQERAHRLGRDVVQGAAAGRTGSEPAPSTDAPPPPDTPPGTMLVPIDAWDKMLLQLGNLHEAGQQLAEARERAAKAETEATFLRERLSELRDQVSREARETPPTQPVQATPSPAEKLSHIPIEVDDEALDEAPDEAIASVDVTDDPGPSDLRVDTDVLVRDLGGKGSPRVDADGGGAEDEGLTMTEYSLEMMKHLYSTWRRRPRR
ncbi:MAG: hypothetical protein WBM90_11140 [Acidimicrobiia bacterium]